MLNTTVVARCYAIFAPADARFPHLVGEQLLLGDGSSRWGRSWASATLAGARVCVPADAAVQLPGFLDRSHVETWL